MPDPGPGRCPTVDGQDARTGRGEEDAEQTDALQGHRDPGPVSRSAGAAGHICGRRYGGGRDGVCARIHRRSAFGFCVV